MSEKRCEHDFLLGQCSLCKEPPIGINAIVYTTKGGQVFHNRHDCEYLQAGQEFAMSKGFDNHMVTPTSWQSVIDTYPPCEGCCASYHLVADRKEAERALMEMMFESE